MMTMKSYIQHISEVKSAVAKRFISILKSKIYRYMSSISKTMYREKLTDIVNKYNNTYNEACGCKC